MFGWGTTKSSKKPKNKTVKRPSRMSCSPMVEGKTVIKDTCYTSDSLLKIKNAYNKNNQTSPINSTNPVDIFNDLNTKLSNCKKEDCWLKQLPKNEQQYLDEYLFAPDQPSDWNKHPRKMTSMWLSNFDIFKVLHQYEQKYKNFKIIGPTPIDFDTKLPEENQKCVWEDLCHFSLEQMLSKKINKIGIVFNLDKHDEDGSHWTSLFIDLEYNFIFYYDSADNSVPTEVKSLIKRIREQGKQLPNPIKFKYYTNQNHQHQTTSSECGMYALFFIITFLTDKTDYDADMTMAKKIKLFKHGTISDKYIKSFRTIYFNN